MEKQTYNMAIYLHGEIIYNLEVEADSLETAREITWDNFIQVAYCDEDEEDEEQ